MEFSRPLLVSTLGVPVPTARLWMLSHKGRSLESLPNGTSESPPFNRALPRFPNTSSHGQNGQDGQTLLTMLPIAGQALISVAITVLGTRLSRYCMSFTSFP